MSSIGGPAGPSRDALGRQASISSLEQSLNMVSVPPTIAPVTIYPGPGARHANMAKADLDLVHRLQQLKGSHGAVPSESEMEERLAKLKGLPTDYYTKQTPHQQKDHRTDHQKTQDLLTQYMEEVQLDGKLPNPDEDLSARLNQLRCGPDARPRPPAATTVASLDSPGLPQGLDDIGEMAKLLNEASSSATAEASSALAVLEADPALAALISQSVKEKKLKRGHKARKAAVRSGYSTDEEERMSASSDEEAAGGGRKQHRVKRMGKSLEKPGAKVEKLTGDEEEEVTRIVDMYTKRVEEKRKKKQLLKKKSNDPKLASKCEAPGSETDSSSELSESDLESSDSEKLSDTSD